MSFFDFILGRPLASNEDAGQRIDSLRGVSIFGLDALSSAAYVPEAALTILLPVGLAGLPYILPISAAIIPLLYASDVAVCVMFKKKLPYRSWYDQITQSRAIPHRLRNRSQFNFEMDDSC
jgi:hypothetical protein